MCDNCEKLGNSRIMKDLLEKKGKLRVVLTRIMRIECVLA